ncbi:MAG: ACT domain-containing protein [Firmicutes bacterium]|nr:ACT domain-containing protein [Bacillota bacterium]
MDSQTKGLKQLSILVPNQPGSLNEVLRVLAEEGIDIHGLSVTDSSDYGILRMMLSNPEKGEACLQRAGFAVKTTEVLAIDVNDTPGGLYYPVRLMADNEINIEYMYAFGTKLDRHAMIIFKTGDNRRCCRILEQAGIPVLGSDLVRERLYG